MLLLIFLVYPVVSLQFLLRMNTGTAYEDSSTINIISTLAKLSGNKKTRTFLVKNCLKPHLNQ